MASWKRPTRPFRSPTMRPSIWRLDELAKVEVRLRLAGSIRVQRRDRKLVGRWVGSYETDDLGSPWVFGPTKTGWVNFLWSMNLWIYELYMKHQVYRCLLAKLKGKERVFKPYLCIRFDVSSVPYAPGEIAWHSKKIPYEYAVPN